MNPTAIYSKSGKGVQEAAGKTSLLARPDRAVLAAIDGRATLADVAQKVGKPFDSTFQQVITKLDKDGFIREVSAGTAVAAGAAAKAGAAARPAPAKPAAKVSEDPASDLDFSMLGGPSKPAPAAPSRPAAPPPKAATPPPAPPPPPKEQESALFKARQEAEAKAVAERERQRKEAEDKVRAETEARLRAEAEAKARAEADARVAAEAEAKVKAAREAAVKAAAEAKAKAEAEARRAREEAERIRKEAEERERRAREEAERLRKEAEERERRAREEAERKAREDAERIRREAEEKARREAEEKARREAEELRQRLEEERRAREEAERKAREETERIRREAEAEAERARKELEEERRRIEEERRAREEEDRRDEEERAARRRAREEEEAREAAEREARRKAREEEEAREEERAARERAAKKPPKAPPPREKAAAPPPPEKSGEEFSDSLMADLDSFNTREEDEAKEKAEAERKAKEEAERRAREEAERRAKEEAEARAKEEKRRAKEEKERKKREEEERLRREEEEEKARIREEEERRKKEAEERAAKAKQEEALTRQATSTTVGYVSEDARRKRQLDVGPRDPSLVKRRQRSWGRPVAVTLFVLLVVALGVAHVMPVSTVDYERAASEALGRPVRIGSARLWLVTGLQLRMENVSAGDVKIGRVIAHPTIGSLTEPRKAFSLIELHGVTLPQDAAGEVLYSRARGDNFSVARVAASRLELPGALALPRELDAEASLDANGAVRLVTVRGADGLVARLEVQGQDIQFSVDAGSFTVPFAPQVSFTTFGMKGTANPSGLQIKQWDGQALNGTLSGTARVRWGGTWRVDGVITARGINAAVFAPALLSEGRGEGTGKFAMSGVEPAKLGAGATIDGNFTISKGVLGSFDLSRAIQTGGKQAQGRTQFTEMNGQVSYDRGEVELRNVTIGAGALNAGASAVISEKGALTGRIVADVRTASQTLRATLLLGGTVKEPQVRN
jgi:hypothetical protein